MKLGVGDWKQRFFELSHCRCKCLELQTMGTWRLVLGNGGAFCVDFLGFVLSRMRWWRWFFCCCEEGAHCWILLSLPCGICALHCDGSQPCDLRRSRKLALIQRSIKVKAPLARCAGWKERHLPPWTGWLLTPLNSERAIHWVQVTTSTYSIFAVIGE